MHEKDVKRFGGHSSNGPFKINFTCYRIVGSADQHRIAVNFELNRVVDKNVRTDTVHGLDKSMDIIFVQSLFPKSRVVPYVIDNVIIIIIVIAKNNVGPVPSTQTGKIFAGGFDAAVVIDDIAR